MCLLFREHPKAQPGRLVFVVVFLETFDRVIRENVFRC